MLKLNRSKPPVDYSKCNQLATIYHFDGTNISKKVVNGVFFDFRKNENVSKTGSTEVNGFLLVIPKAVTDGTQPVFNGDKVMLGEGPDILDRAGWAAFIPSKVPNLVVVKYVDPKYWMAEVAHWEAGG